ncbi:hypothetical protein SO694_00031115 [Aureococcus anophagefferens]|uniref:Ribosome biogenesis protein NOP53 n=1 Tax=Aureococcus anophagefferens TaxID=44056 RepID=A0ABR1FJH8_AURAN
MEPSKATKPLVRGGKKKKKRAADAELSALVEACGAAAPSAKRKKKQRKLSPPHAPHPAAGGQAATALAAKYAWDTDYGDHFETSEQAFRDRRPQGAVPGLRPGLRPALRAAAARVRRRKKYFADACAETGAAPFFVSPARRRALRVRAHPRGTGKAAAPFASAWVVDSGRGAAATAALFEAVAKLPAYAPGAAAAAHRSRAALAGGGQLREGKRPNPRQRKKKRARAVGA